MRLKYIRPSQPGHPGAGKWSLLAAIAATALVASVALTGAGSAGATPVAHAQTNQTTVLNPAAHQMAELNFLLGRYRCLSTPGDLTTYESTSKILDGNYYQMVVKFLIPGAGMFTAYWTLGWDSVDHNYIGQYFDNLGTTGTATSAGWQNGHLKFPGQYVKVVTPGGASGAGQGARQTAQDDFVSVGPGHYIDSGSVLQNGQWVSASGSDCQKI